MSLFNWYRYPVRIQDSVSEDPRSVTEHNKALHEEMKKAKLRDTLMLPLMKNTYLDVHLSTMMHQLWLKYSSTTKPLCTLQWCVKNAYMLFAYSLMYSVG